MASTQFSEGTYLPHKEIFFQTKQVVITGGASGIGFALSERLSNLGAKISALDISPNNHLSERVASINADVTKKLELITQNNLKEVDILIISAGFTSETNNPTAEEKKRMKEVNINGVKNTLDYFSPLLSKNAQVVYIGSDDPPKEYYAETKKKGAQIIREFSQKHPDIITKIIYLGPVRTPLFMKGKTPETVTRIQNNVGLYEPSEFAEELIDNLRNTSINGLQEKVMYKKFK